MRNHRRLQWITDPRFSIDVRNFLRSRSVLVVAGNVGTLIVAVVAVVHFWSRPHSVASYVVVQSACLLCQAIAMIPVVWPGSGSSSSSAEAHQGMAVSLLCITGVFGVPPALMLFAAFGVETDMPPWAAVLASGVALMLACVASLMASVPFDERARAPRRRVAGPPEESDWAELAESGGADSGGSDGD